jgi:hypothetical protein
VTGNVLGQVPLTPHSSYDRRVPPIRYPDRPLGGETFVLRRFRARDFDAAVAARDDREAARWVNTIPLSGGGAMARYLEAQRRRGTLFHFAIVDPGDRDYLGEIASFSASHKRRSLRLVRLPM